MQTINVIKTEAVIGYQKKVTKKTSYTKINIQINKLLKGEKMTTLFDKSINKTFSNHL